MKIRRFFRVYLLPISSRERKTGTIRRGKYGISRPHQHYFYLTWSRSFAVISRRQRFVKLQSESWTRLIGIRGRRLRPSHYYLAQKLSSSKEELRQTVLTNDTFSYSTMNSEDLARRDAPVSNRNEKTTRPCRTVEQSHRPFPISHLSIHQLRVRSLNIFLAAYKTREKFIKGIIDDAWNDTHADYLQRKARSEFSGYLQSCLRGIGGAKSTSLIYLSMLSLSTLLNE